MALTNWDKAKLDYELHMAAGFVIGFWGGIVALILWLIWKARNEP
jgi:hypothetical protein